MPKLVTITHDGIRYLATVDGGPSFEVARRVTYAARGGQTVGLAGSRGATDKYDPNAYAAQFGIWAYFIAPTAQCESHGSFATVNTTTPPFSRGAFYNSARTFPTATSFNSSASF